MCSLDFISIYVDDSVDRLLGSVYHNEELICMHLISVQHCTDQGKHFDHTRVDGLDSWSCTVIANVIS